MKAEILEEEQLSKANPKGAANIFAFDYNISMQPKKLIRI